MERRPRIPSRWPLPPQPQKLSFGSSVTTVWPHGRSGEFAAQSGRQRRLQSESLGLLEIGRVFDNTVSNDAGKTDADGLHFGSIGYFLDLLADAINDAF